MKRRRVKTRGFNRLRRRVHTLEQQLAKAEAANVELRAQVEAAADALEAGTLEQ